MSFLVTLAPGCAPVVEGSLRATVSGDHAPMWIVGRIRLDDRAGLCARLGAPLAANDEKLCLLAYAKWGRDCVNHLRGDFGFALWDEEKHCLFCVRDQLGVRPLFHAAAKGRHMVSDSLDCLRRTADFDTTLDEYWIGDFLSSGYWRDADRTVYKNIRRLPPAHTLLITQAGAAIARYWRLELGDPLRYPRRADYLDRFHEVLSHSIRDRLPEGRVGILMSGGLDSSTLVAMTTELTGDATRVAAETVHYEKLVPDDEAPFASLVAQRLGIRLNLRALDSVRYDPLWETRSLATPEPSLQMINAVYGRSEVAERGAEAQVWFYGEGPDNALTFEWTSYLRWLRQKRDWRRLASATAHYVRGKTMQEWLATARRAVGRRESADGGSQESLPGWIEPALARKIARLEEREDRQAPHPWRPKAVASFGNALWSQLFDDLDMWRGESPIEWRHPYLDLRVLDFMLSTPAIPWGRHKRLVREAMRDRLPQAVLERPKTPAQGDPLATLVREHPSEPTGLCDATRAFVDQTRTPHHPRTNGEIHESIKIRVLDCWLRANMQ